MKKANKYLCLETYSEYKGKLVKHDSKFHTTVSVPYETLIKRAKLTIACLASDEQNA